MGYLKYKYRFRNMKVGIRHCVFNLKKTRILTSF